MALEELMSERVLRRKAQTPSLLVWEEPVRALNLSRASSRVSKLQGPLETDF